MQTNRSVAELELRTREKVEAAKKKMSLEIAELKERLKASRENINVLKGEIRRLEEDDQMKDHWGGLQTGREHKHVSHQNLCEYLTAFWTVLTDFCMNKTVLQILSDYCPVLFKHLVSSSFTENDPLKPIIKYQICMYNII